MQRIREEILIFNIIIALAIISWFFFPIFEIKSINYGLSIIPLGFKIQLFTQQYFLISPLTIAGIAFLILSAIIPLVWTSSRYSLYTSLSALGFGIVMIINAFIYQQRYLHFYGYSVLPTSTGYFYILFPSSTIYGLPLYLIIGSFVISILNAATRARWLYPRRLTLLEKLYSELQRGEVIKGLQSLINSLGIYATVEGNVAKVEDLVLTKANRIEELPSDVSIFFPKGEQIIIGDRKVVYIDKEGNVEYLNLNEGVKLALTKIIEKVNFNNLSTNENLYK